MHVITRRATLVSAGVLAAGTVAAGALWRKPAAPPVATPLTGPEEEAPSVRLQSIAALVPTDPPRAMPEIHFTDGTGTIHSLAEYAGSGVVLNLWATWCVPCVAELPALAELSRQGAALGIVVVPLSSDRGGAEVVRHFYAAHGLEALPVRLDPKGEAGRALGARGIPTTLVIDRQGRERGRLEGSADWAAAATLARLRELVG
jgi:thiol-disulfide isomerase/thioredoxin